MISRFFQAFYTKLFFRDRILAGAAGALLLLHGLLWLLLVLGLDTFRSGDREYIILHYKIFFGTDFVARWFSIFLLPFVGLTVLAINIFLQGALYHIERRLAYAMSFTALLVQVLLLLGLTLLIQINLY